MAEESSGGGSIRSRVSESSIDTIISLLRTSPDGLTRQSLVTESRLSRPTVSLALSRLFADRRVSENTERPVGTGRGRPSRRIRLNPSRADALGIELGRAHVAIAIADAAASIVATRSLPVDPALGLLERLDIALDLCAALCVEQKIEMDAIRRVGVGTPGPRFLNEKTESTDFSRTRLIAERRSVADRLETIFGVPVDVDNNVQLTALAESARRAVSGAELVYVRVDEGIGGGVVTDGRLAAGSSGAAGEIGHICVELTAGRCPCGGRGCLELFASMPALVHRAGSASMAAFLSEVAGGEHTAIIAEAAVRTGGVIAGVVSLIDPSIVVLGGSVSALPGFTTIVESTIRDVAPAWCTHDLIIEFAPNDFVSGAVGAAVSAGRLAAPAPSSLERRPTKGHSRA